MRIGATQAPHRLASSLVADLEAAYDREEDQSFGALPSGDAIAAEFERYLRERNPEDPPAGR